MWPLRKQFQSRGGDRQMAEDGGVNGHEMEGAKGKQTIQ